MSLPKKSHAQIYDPDLPATFERLQHAVDHPLDAANSGKNSAPSLGYVLEAKRATERGRRIIAGQDAATERGREQMKIIAEDAERRGLRTFPPARQVVR